MSRKRYSAYKPSGVEWLGEIPEGWDIQRLKYCVAMPNDKTDETNPELPYIGLENIESWTGNLMPGNDTCEGQANVFVPGDVLFGKLRPYLAKVYASKMHGLCSGEFLVLRPTSVHQPFLHKYLLNRDFIFTVDSSTYGAKMPRANRDFIGSMPGLIPPVHEQRSIAAFLDRETSRIDELIAKKERQIELLQEKRSALISHVVTKGLDPHVKMKDSGVEWLGEIPEHWKVSRAKNIFREINERSNTGEEELLTVSHITGVTRRSEKDVNMFMAETLEGYKRCQRGDLVINTMWAWMGAMGVAQEMGIVSPSYNVYRFKVSDVDDRYYDLLFRTGFFINKAMSQSQGVWKSRLRLYPEAFLEIRLPFPPPNEQRLIVDTIDEDIGHFENLKKKVELSINLLREYRTALISAAVTGKIDVREEVPQCQ